MQTGQLAAVTGIDRCQPAAFRRLFAPSPNFSVAREGLRGGVGEGWKIGVWGLFCGGWENSKRLSPKFSVSAERKRDSALAVWNESIAGVAIHARVDSGFGSHRRSTTRRQDSDSLRLAPAVGGTRICNAVAWWSCGNEDTRCQRSRIFRAGIVSSFTASTATNRSTYPFSVRTESASTG